MFDIGWSELLIVGTIALLLVGPNDLPRFLRLLGRQIGAVRRHANEFRSVFDQAMREAELDSLQSEVRKIGDDVKGSIDEATRSVDHAKAAMRVDLNTNRAVEPPGAETAPSETPEEAAARAEGAASPPSDPAAEAPEAPLPAAGDKSEGAG